MKGEFAPFFILPVSQIRDSVIQPDTTKPQEIKSVLGVPG